MDPVGYGSGTLVKIKSMTELCTVLLLKKLGCNDRRYPVPMDYCTEYWKTYSKPSKKGIGLDTIPKALSWTAHSALCSFVCRCWILNFWSVLSSFLEPGRSESCKEKGGKLWEGGEKEQWARGWSSCSLRKNKLAVDILSCTVPTYRTVRWKGPDSVVKLCM